MGQGGPSTNGTSCFSAVPGMHGAKWANWALNHADLILAAGARFDDRVTGRLDAFAPEATVVHFEVDRYEIDKIRRADVAVVARISRMPLRDLVAQLRARSSAVRWRPAGRGSEQVEAWRPAGFRCLLRRPPPRR